MNRIAKLITLSVGAISLATAGNAFAGVKYIVNDTDGLLFVVAVPRTANPDDIIDNENPVFKIIPPGKTRRLIYQEDFLNQFLVSHGSYCGVTVNLRGDSGDNTLNTNSVLTITEQVTAPEPDNEKRGSEVCLVTGSNP